MSEPWVCARTGNEIIPEHVQRAWRDNGGEAALQVKNTFISPVKADCNKQLVRSKSWSVTSSSASRQQDTSGRESSSDQDATRQQHDASPHYTCEMANSFASQSSNGGSMTEAAQLAAKEAMEQSIDSPINGWSEGGKLHDSGECVPCIHIVRGFSCARGDNCRFCHLEHGDPKKLRRRPCKSTRDRCKLALDQLEERDKDDPEAKQEKLQSLIAKHPYILTLVSARDGTEHQVETQSSVRQSSHGAAPNGARGQASGNVHGNSKVSV